MWPYAIVRHNGMVNIVNSRYGMKIRALIIVKIMESANWMRPYIRCVFVLAIGLDGNVRIHRCAQRPVVNARTKVR